MKGGRMEISEERWDGELYKYIKSQRYMRTEIDGDWKNVSYERRKTEKINEVTKGITMDNLVAETQKHMEKERKKVT